MRQEWTTDEIVEHFALGEDEYEFVSIQETHNKLGKALLLNFFQHECRFPEGRSEIPLQAVDYVAQQLGLSPDIFKAYQCPRWSDM